MKMLNTMDVPDMPKRVTVEEADNGYVVRGMDKKGKETQLVCKTLGEASGAFTSLFEDKGTKGENYQQIKTKANNLALNK